MIINGIEIKENDLVVYGRNRDRVISLISEIIQETNSIRIKDIYDLNLKKQMNDGYFVASFESMKHYLTNLKVVGHKTLEDVIEKTPEIFI